MVHISSGRSSLDDNVEEGLLEKNHYEFERGIHNNKPWHPSVNKLASFKNRLSSIHMWLSYAANVLLLGATIALSIRLQIAKRKDPSLGVWSPGNDVVEYHEQHFTAALFNKTEYMGFPTDETDKLWSDLYNMGISKISAEDAKRLPSPTLPIPGTNEYLIQFDVWHELHCLNDLRKIIFPERFPQNSLGNITVDGIINRDTDMFRHWDHCIDSLRQTLMCHSDISPIPFHVNVPKAAGIFPRLATTHTCRNFTKIQEWAREHTAGEFRFLLDKEEARRTIETAGFDQSPEENIQELYDLFPGNEFFEHWRTHKVCVEGEICPGREEEEITE